MGQRPAGRKCKTLHEADAGSRNPDRCRMTLLETLALLTFVLTLLSLIVDVIRLTVEVMAKFSQKKDDDNKKD